MNKIQIVPAQSSAFNPPKVISNEISELQKNLPGFPVETTQENISKENQTHAANYYYLLNGRHQQYANLLKGVKYFLEENKNIDFEKLQFSYNGSIISGRKVLDVLVTNLHFLRSFPKVEYCKEALEILEKHFTGDFPPQHIWKDQTKNKLHDKSTK